MRIDDYQQKATLTAIYPDEVSALLASVAHHNQEHAILSKLLRLNYVAAGLAGEAGEFNNKVKKLIRDHSGYLNDEQVQELSKELGGVLWYTSQAAREIGKSLESIARRNLDILADRQSRGAIHGSGDDR
jgi:NTP pyrophosphatase (non-canonical NTP hydrolase)